MDKPSKVTKTASHAKKEIAEYNAKWTKEKKKRKVPRRTFDIFKHNSLIP